MAASQARGAFVSYTARNTPWSAGFHVFVSEEHADLEVSATVQSAMYAMHRMVAREGHPVALQRDQAPTAVLAGLDARLQGFEHLLALPIYSAGQRVSGCLVVLDAVREQRVDELAALAASGGLAMYNAGRYAIAQRDQERLFLFADATTEALWEWNPQRSTMWWGSGIWKLLGDVEPEPDSSMDWKMSLIHRDDVDRVRTSFARALVKGESVWSDEYRLRVANDSSLFVEERAYFMRDFKGAPIRVVGIIHDVSERKAMEDAQTSLVQLQEADRLKDQFLSMVSHELRTPLNAILGFSTLLEEEIAHQLSHKHQGFLQLVTSSSHNLLALVNDLLDLQRLTAGKVEISVQPLILSDVVDEVIQRLQPLARKRNIRLDNAVPMHLPHVRADRQRLAQVLANLLGNSVRYTDEGDTVHVRATAAEAGTRIEVVDHGPGIDVADMPRLFQRFSRIERTVHRNQGWGWAGFVHHQDAGRSSRRTDRRRQRRARSHVLVHAAARHRVRPAGHVMASRFF